jgi:hypothetical protein
VLELVGSDQSVDSWFDGTANHGNGVQGDAAVAGVDQVVAAKFRTPSNNAELNQ